MRVILLSGGSGERLWPVSHMNRPKQFIRIIPSEDNRLDSMIERVWSQLKKNGLTDNTYVSTTAPQAQMIHSYIGTEVPLIIEPDRRDTFPAIALGAAYLHSVVGADRNEVVAVIPVDPYVENEFFTHVKRLESILRQTKMDIALIGARPSYPSTKYGYILSESQGHLEQPRSYRIANRFVEKPTEPQAGQLIEQGALWNCGVFAFTLGFILEQLERRGISTQYNELAINYGQLRKISFDYEILEKTDRIAVVPYEGAWKDMGTWNTLVDDLPVNVVGRGMQYDRCDNTHIVNELDIPIVVIGVSDIVVAASSEGILVTAKSKSQHVKDVVHHLAKGAGR